MRSSKLIIISRWALNSVPIAMTPLGGILSLFAEIYEALVEAGTSEEKAFPTGPTAACVVP